MSKKTRSEEIVDIFCDICGEDADSYEQYDIDLCRDHERVFKTLYDEISRLQQEKAEQIVKAFMLEEDKLVQQRITEFLKKNIQVTKEK